MIYTIGHSTLPVEDFIDQISNIKIIVDIRSHPTSKWPQWRKEEMEGWLHRAGKQYVWEPSLGGWNASHGQDNALIAKMLAVDVDVPVYARGKFPKQRIGVDRDMPSAPTHPLWYNQGLYDYSWFTTIPEFRFGVEQLVAISQHNDVVIVCAEARWWKCHRSMVADYLYYHKIEANHIMGNKISPHSKAISNRIERYDPRIIETWS